MTSHLEVTLCRLHQSHAILLLNSLVHKHNFCVVDILFSFSRRFTRILYSGCWKNNLIFSLLCFSIFIKFIYLFNWKIIPTYFIYNSCIDENMNKLNFSFIRLFQLFLKAFWSRTNNNNGYFSVIYIVYILIPLILYIQFDSSLAFILKISFKAPNRLLNFFQSNYSKTFCSFFSPNG